MITSADTLMALISVHIITVFILQIRWWYVYLLFMINVSLLKIGTRERGGRGLADSPQNDFTRAIFFIEALLTYRVVTDVSVSVAFFRFVFPPRIVCAASVRASACLAAAMVSSRMVTWSRRMRGAGFVMTTGTRPCRIRMKVKLRTRI